MSIAVPSMLASEDRPVGLRMRTDLFIQQSVYQGENCWIVKDPLSMKYYRLREPEHLVLTSLDANITYRRLQSLLTNSYPQHRIRLESVQHLITQLHRSGLLISQASGQAIPLSLRSEREKFQKIIGLGLSFLSIRFPGWDPERFLNWLYPKCRFVFSVWFTCLALLLCGTAVLLLATNYGTFIAMLPDFQSFFAVENLLVMAGLLFVTKSIHEMGHALMCKHFGGECHEIGLMLLVGTPAMYCDTSDSWILANRWKRMAIGAAGMYVELVLAAACTIIWWYTNPGWLHYLALNVMFLSSVSTVVFNANPLLRYDGYYILSDFLEIPNLAQKSSMAFAMKFRELFLGMKTFASLIPARHTNALAAYCVLSFIYRCFITISILWFISRVFEPYGLSPVSDLIIVATLSGFVLWPVYKIVSFLSYPGRSRGMNAGRVYGSVVLLICALMFVWFVPLPHYVWASFVIRPHLAQALVISQPGRLEQRLKAEGQTVEIGDAIAILSNDELSIELDGMRGRLARLQSDKAAFEFSTSTDFDSARRIAETVSQIASLEKQILLKERQIGLLEIKASRSGQLIAPPNVLPPMLKQDQLPQWTDTPLANQNVGTFLAENTLIGWIGDPREVEIILVVEQSDINLIQQGQKVIALPDQMQSAYCEAVITDVSQEELSIVPRELSQTNKGPIPVQLQSETPDKPLIRSYTAKARFTGTMSQDAPQMLLAGMRGYAKIDVGYSTLVERFARYMKTLLHFR